MGKSAVQIAAHILRMTADESSDEKMFQSFIDKIRALKSDSPELMHLTYQAKVILVSATEMPMENRGIFEEVLQDKIGAGLTISYLIDKELVAGYELKFETFILHHNIRKYIEESEKKIMETLEKNS